MHDLLIALAFIGMVVAPAIVAAKSSAEDIDELDYCLGSLTLFAAPRICAVTAAHSTSTPRMRKTPTGPPPPE